MSTIVAVEKNERVAIAWDTLDTFGSARCVNKTGPPKVIRAGSSFVGCAGFSVYNNLLDHYLQSRRVASLKNERLILEFFIRFWQELHRRYHFVDDQADSEERSPFADLGAEFLVVNRYGLFGVKEILNVSRFDRFCAIGSGAPHAEGALQVLYQQGGKAMDDAEKAVRVALEFDAASGGPIEVREMPKHGAHRRKRTPTARKKPAKA